MQTNNTVSATDVGCAVLPFLQVGRGYTFGLLLALISTGAQAQSDSSVTVEGVAGGVGSVAVPVMTHPWLLLAAALVVGIGLCKLRQFAALSVLALTTVVLVSHQPGLRAAVTELVIAQDSQVCHGSRETLEYDADADMALINQCDATTVRIVEYQLSCPADNHPEEMNDGFILPAGKSTSLLRCIDPAPEMTLGGPLGIDEDAGPQTVPAWVSVESLDADGEPTQPVTLAIAADDMTLFSAGPTLADDGTLSFTPADDAFGSTRLTVTATDPEGADAEESAQLTITPVNDPPSFTLSSAVVSVLEDNGLDTGTDPNEPEYDEGPDGADSAPVSVDNVATDISPGNAWEADQSVHFEISRYAGSDVYSDEYVVYKGAQPGAEPGDILDTQYATGVELPIISGADNYQLSSAGTFSTELTPHAWGVVELSVVAVDGKGLKSPSQRLSLEVAPVWDTRPRWRDEHQSGDENSSCIQTRLYGSTFRNSHRPQFILTETDLNGGRLAFNSLDVVFGIPIVSSSLCYIPPRDMYSEYNTDTGTFEPFASFTYRVWSGVGDWRTGESPALNGGDHSGVFLELSEEEYTVEIVVRPVF